MSIIAKLRVRLSLYMLTLNCQPSALPSLASSVPISRSDLETPVLRSKWSTMVHKVKRAANELGGNTTVLMISCSVKIASPDLSTWRLILFLRTLAPTLLPHYDQKAFVGVVFQPLLLSSKVYCSVSRNDQHMTNGQLPLSATVTLSVSREQR
jgi:hypothetical protein